MDGVATFGGAWGLEQLAAWGRRAGDPEVIRWAELANEHEPRAAPLRPLRPPHRHGRVPPRLPRADDRGGRRRPARGAVGRRPPGCPRRARRPLRRVDAGRGGSRLPDLDDVLRRAGAAHRSGHRRGVDAAADVVALRPPRRAGGREVRRPRRHGDDREAGRQRRPGQHDPSRTGRWWLSPHGTQVVLLGADERPVPDARPGARRPVLSSRCRAGCPTASATPSASNGSRTSSATAPTRRARSSSTARGGRCSATRAPAWRRSSAWSTTRGSTA